MCAAVLLPPSEPIRFLFYPSDHTERPDPASVNDDSFIPSRSSVVNFANSVNFPLALTGSPLVTPRPRRLHRCSSFHLSSPFRVLVIPHFLSTQFPTKIMASSLLKAVAEGDLNAVLAILQSTQSADIELAGSFGFFRSPFPMTF